MYFFEFVKSSHANCKWGNLVSDLLLKLIIKPIIIFGLNGGAKDTTQSLSQQRY